MVMFHSGNITIGGIKADRLGHAANLANMSKTHVLSKTTQACHKQNTIMLNMKILQKISTGKKKCPPTSPNSEKEDQQKLVRQD